MEAVAVILDYLIVALEVLLDLVVVVVRSVDSANSSDRLLL